MAHLDNMLELLPHLYRDGALVQGVLGAPAVEHEFIDLAAFEVQRAHHFNATYDLEEAVNLGALLDIPVEEWQTLRTYRAWVHAYRDAILRFGTVTGQASIHFVGEYSAGFQAAEGLDIISAISSNASGWLQVPAIDGDPSLQAPLISEESPYSWRATYQYERPVFVENPPKRLFKHVPGPSGLEPLHQFTIDQKGLDESLTSLLYTGIPGPREFCPTLINVTTGQALVYLGEVPIGERLWIRPLPDGQIEAELEGEDVSANVYSVSQVTPGTAWEVDETQSPAETLRLARGINQLWFLPIAHFGAPGLDRVLLALGGLDLKQGRYDLTNFDQSLFYQDPGVTLFMSWLETQPAAYEVHLPSPSLRRRIAIGENTVEAREEALAMRDTLQSALTSGVNKLKGAGIEASVHFIEFQERQQQLDRLTMIQPIKLSDAGTMGTDRVVDAGGTFGVTDFNDSTFQ